MSGDALDRIQSRSGDPSVPLLEAVRAAASERASRALAAEIAALSDEDRLLVRRRFFDGARLLDVARETAEAPTIVYRRLARLLAVLRRRLEQRGIPPFDVAQLLPGITLVTLRRKGHKEHEDQSSKYFVPGLCGLCAGA